MSSNPEKQKTRDFVEYIGTQSEQVSETAEILPAPLNPAQEAECNVMTDEAMVSFDRISALKNAVESKHQPMMAIFYQTALKEHDRIQNLLLEAREVGEEGYEEYLAQILSEINSLVETENSAVKKAIELGYDIEDGVEEAAEVVAEVAKLPEVVRPEVKENNSTSVESQINSEHVESLVEKYKSLDKSVFYAQDGKFKDVGLIEKEIGLVFKYEGFQSENVTHFFNEIKDSLNTLKRAESNFIDAAHPDNQDVQTQNEANKAAKAVFDELIQSVHAFLQIESVDRDNNQESAEVESIEPDVDEEISKVAANYETLLKEIMSIGFDSDTNATVAILDKVLDGLFSNKKETDKTVARNNKAKYLKQFAAKFAELKQEVEAFKKTQSELPTVEHVTDSEQTAVQHEGVTEKVSEPVVSEVLNEESVEGMPEESEPEAVSEDTVEVPSKKIELVYKNKREHWTTKDTFKEKESEYKSAMEAFYQDKSISAKARNTIHGVSKLFGFKPVLPDDLQLLQAQYKETRQLYAASLDGMLAERALSATENPESYNEYDSSSDAAKIAFGRKFILEPNEEILRLQAREIMSPENKARLMRVMEVMKKYKWPVRVGMVVGAGTLAAGTAAAAGVASLGVVGAAATGGGFKAARIAASAILGAGSGIAAKKITQRKVDTARGNFETAKSDVTKNFTLEDLNKLEELLQSKEFDKTRAENIQKTAVVGSAVATGLAGYGASSYFEGAEVPETGVEEVGVTENPVVEAVENIEPQTFTLGEFSVTHDGGHDGVDYKTILHDIKLEGTNLDSLSDANKAELDKFIKITSNDLLSPQRNMPEATLEELLLEKVNKHFADSAWLNESGISKIDIGHLELKQIGLTEKLVEHELKVSGISEESVPEVAPVEEIKVSETTSKIESNDSTPVKAEVVREYEIKKGENLWNITKNQFGDKLKGLSTIEQNEVIDRTLDKIQANPDLMKSIGIKDDVDEIYAGEKLNLTALESEVDRVIERNSILDDFRKSAPIMVESDAGAKDVPISFKVKTAPEVVEINAQPSGKVAVDPVPPFEEVAKKPSLASLASEPKVSPIAPFEKASTSASVEVVNIPDIKPLNGEYYSHPEYKKYITQTYGSVDKFDGVVRKAAEEFDKNTYDVFERAFGGYTSPYTFLSEIKLKDLAEYKNPANLAELKNLLASKEVNVKYESYLSWMDLIDNMKKSLPNIETTKVSDLFSRYVAESAKGTFPFSTR